MEFAAGILEQAAGTGGLVSFRSTCAPMFSTRLGILPGQIAANQYGPRYKNDTDSVSKS